MQTIDQQFQEAVSYLYHFIPKTNMKLFPGEYGLKRTYALLSFLGNPQEKIKVIHIAGTSGKGSTALILSHLLQSHGFKVGLHVKPHLIDIRERLQINNTLISKELFISYLNDVKKAVEKMSQEKFGKPTYFEVIVSLAYYIFFKEKVDYAVIESGVGGLFDGSNTIDNPEKLVLLTSIGYDHMGILGNTLEEIAFQKAMIMRKGNIAFSIEQPLKVKKVFEKVSIDQVALLSFITAPGNFGHITVSQEKTAFDFSYESYSWKNLKLHLHGSYQAENAALALSGLVYLSQRDRFLVKEKTVRSSLEHITFPGRFEIRKANNKTIVIDGAHNTQKMKAFLSNLTTIFPGKKFTFLLGFKEGKEVEAMVKMIIPLASKVYLTGFFNDQVDFVVNSENPEDVAALFKRHGYQNVVIEENMRDSIKQVIQEIDNILVITGSLYMISDIYPALEL